MQKSTLQTWLIAVVLVLSAANLALNASFYAKMSGLSLGSDNRGGDSIVAADGKKISSDDDPALGSKNAKVTIVEFSDYECPYCGRFYTQTLPEIKSQYIDTGKVRFVYRDFPLGFHANAQKAAEASECADEQGKFWEYHDKLFLNSGALDVASLKSYAKAVGLDSAKFDTCLDTGAMAAEVQKDSSEGASYGVTGTPAFFVNGVSISGAQPFSVFQQAIEQALAAK